MKKRRCRCEESEGSLVVVASYTVVSHSVVELGIIFFFIDLLPSFFAIAQDFECKRDGGFINLYREFREINRVAIEN